MRTYQLLTALTLGVIALAEHSSIATSDNQVQSLYDLPVVVLKPVAVNPPSLAGDVNHDGIVNAADILALFENWGGCTGVGITANGSASDDADQASSCEGDLDSDQVVGQLDLIIVLKSWG